MWRVYFKLPFHLLELIKHALRVSLGILQGGKKLITYGNNVITFLGCVNHLTYTNLRVVGQSAEYP